MSAPPLSRGLLLDLDGTLLDTAPDMAGALNRLLREEGRPELPFASVRPHVSHGAAALVRLGFGTQLPEAEFERLRRRFLAVYSEHLSAGTRLFPGFGAVLDRLEQRMNWRQDFPRGDGTKRRGRGIAIGFKASIAPTTSIARECGASPWVGTQRSPSAR